MGSVLLNYLTYEKYHCKKYNHAIITLDYANDYAHNICSKNNIKLYQNLHNNPEKILSLIESADIILFHYWNHPLLYEFIIKNPLPSSRVIFWAHTSGLFAPNIFTSKIIDYSDKFIFTTSISHCAKEVTDYKNKQKFKTIFSTGGVEKFLKITPKPHSGFNIGYIGTVDYVKLHPAFLQICSKIDIPSAKFIVIGGDKDKKIKKQYENLNIDKQILFTGKIQDITDYLTLFDVFGYPLNPNHYGTAEQVLQEAMAAGVVPVVLANKVEKSIIKHFETGLIANSLEEYVKYIKKLYYEPELKIELSKKCKEYAKRNFSIKKLSEEWDKIFTEVLGYNKKIHKYSTKMNWEAYEIFLESLGEYKQPFVLYLDKNEKNKLIQLLKKPEWQSESKGTPKQYLKFIPDINLERICKLYAKE